MGRRKGSRNKGFWYRSGRGWFTDIEGTSVPLTWPNGDRMRDKHTPEKQVREAYHRLMVNGNSATKETGATVADVCTAYLANVKDSGAEGTFSTRAASLYDFCTGYPPRFRDKQKRKSDPKPSDRLHKGFGQMAAEDLKWLHVDQWLQAHPTWNGSRRTHIQALKRALHYGVERGMIEFNAVEGYDADQPTGRVTYLTPEQEKALIEHANPAFATALTVCIRTGARHGCEFAKVTAKHVVDHGNRMEWIFRPEESKTGKLRTIRITDPGIIAIVRERLGRLGPIFRNNRDDMWKRENLALNFRRTRDRTGLKFDDDAVMYSCRHTFAKRTLQGYWTGKATNIETLAELMGNTPEVCRKHYLQWCDSYSEPLWDAV